MRPPRTKVRATSIDYENPRRPALVRLINRLGKAGVPRQAFGSLDVEQMLHRAREKTGLSDFGDEWFLRPLGVLVDSINTEAELTPIGKLIQRTRIEGNLAARLRVEAHAKQYPELEQVELDRMILIAGLQRTGTTTLHRLIAADPCMRALMAWEAMNPVPLARDPGVDLKKRMRASRVSEQALAYLAPEFFAVHPVEHDAPEEDVLLLDYCFMSQSWEVLMNVPSYASWLEAQDHAPAYEYLRRLLKLLLGARPGRHWVLKSPHHAEYIDLVLTVLPEATIVLTHRDPLVSAVSFLSMVAHGRAVSSDRVDVRRVADQWVRKTERLMRRLIEARQQASPDRFVDVSYYEFLKNPVGELRRVYERSGIKLDQQAVEAARAQSRKDTQHRYGRHLYDLKVFGLDRQALDERFGFYREAYGIPYE